MMNPTFLDYRMPTSLDLPMIDTVIVEVANSGHPYGVRGVGEVPIVPPMARHCQQHPSGRRRTYAQPSHEPRQDTRGRMGTSRYVSRTNSVELSLKCRRFIKRRSSG